MPEDSIKRVTLRALASLIDPAIIETPDCVVPVEPSHPPIPPPAIDDDDGFGSVLKQGGLQTQNHATGFWVDAAVVLYERGITVTYKSDGHGSPITKSMGLSPSNPLFPKCLENCVDIEILPDHARRSRGKF